MYKIYLDNAAATPIDSRVEKEMIRVNKIYGNPSSFNNYGRVAREELEKARLLVAKFLGAHKDEIIFTSSGSESNSLAILGSIEQGIRQKGEILVSPIEHPSVLESVARLKDSGYRIKFLKVDSMGRIDIDDLKSKISDKTILISVMYANNEIGTIQPITKILKIINDFKNENPSDRVPARMTLSGWIRADPKFKISKTAFPLFHVDACQATEYLSMKVNGLGADLLTLNGSKIYGPRGVGVLYVRRGIKIKPFILGGDQENGLRAGTENLPAIAGMAKALSLINKKDGERTAKLRDYFFGKIDRLSCGIRLNGALRGDRLSNNINISIPDLSSEVLLLELDKYGISAGSGSACTAHSVEPSHVLKAIGVDKKYLNGALRFSLGRQTTKNDIDYLLKILPKIIKILRERYGDIR